MCGIAGFVARIDQREAQSVAQNMARTLRHRGPDSQDAEVLPLPDGSMLGLSHSLLRIIGKPGEGRQPFHVEGGVLTYNGEIYNYRELVPEIEKRGRRLRTSTDTEVLAHGLVTEGIDFLERTRGMYVFAFWDSSRHTLLLGRDPFGAKPLYYAKTTRGIIFGSEYKVILPHLRSADVDEDAVSDYLRFRYVPGPATLVKQIRKVPPGTVLSLDMTSQIFKEHKYFSLQADSKKPSPEEVFRRLENAVSRRAVADVEVAALLSGGIDSSVVCEILSRSVKSLHTYTLDVGDPKLDETDAAQKISAAIGAVNFRIPPPELKFEDLQRLTYHLDDPYGDPIILSLDRIFSFIGGQQRVLVTGEGSDEIFSGYVHHRAMGLLEKVPSALLSTALNLMRGMPRAAVRLALPYASSMSPEDYRRALERVSSWKQRSLNGFLSTFFLFDDTALRNPTSGNIGRAEKSGMDLTSLRSWDLKHWLPDSQLFKLDKISMASSIEAREPFVDTDLIRCVNAIPAADHIAWMSDKPILRNAIRGRMHFNEALIGRRKTSFFQPFTGQRAAEMISDIRTCVLDNEAVLADFLSKTAIASTMNGHDGGLLGQKRTFALGALAAWWERVWPLRSQGTPLD